MSGLTGTSEERESIAAAAREAGGEGGGLRDSYVGEGGSALVGHCGWGHPAPGRGGGGGGPDGGGRLLPRGAGGAVERRGVVVGGGGFCEQGGVGVGTEVGGEFVDSVSGGGGRGLGGLAARGRGPAGGPYGGGGEWGDPGFTLRQRRTSSMAYAQAHLRHFQPGRGTGMTIEKGGNDGVKGRGHGGYSVFWGAGCWVREGGGRGRCGVGGWGRHNRVTGRYRRGRCPGYPRGAPLRGRGGCRCGWRSGYPRGAPLRGRGRHRRGVGIRRHWGHHRRLRHFEEVFEVKAADQVLIQGVHRGEVLFVFVGPRVIGVDEAVFAPGPEGDEVSPVPPFVSGFGLAYGEEVEEGKFSLVYGVVEDFLDEGVDLFLVSELFGGFGPGGVGPG